MTRPTQKYLRYGILAFLCLAYGFILYWEPKVMFDFSHDGLVKFHKPSAQDYATGLTDITSAFERSPKWGHNIVYMFSTLILTTSIIHFAFLKRQLTKATFLIYAGLGLIVVSLMLTGLLFESKNLAYAAPRFIKNKLLQTPYVLLVTMLLGWIGVQKEKRSQAREA